MTTAKDNSSDLDFSVPSGFKVPDGVQPGDEFNAVGTFRLEQDGQLCLVDIEGAAVSATPDKNNKEADTSPDNNTSFVDSVEKGLAA